MDRRLLARFRDLFDGKAYHHRRSTQGDAVAVELFEDLVELGRSPRLAQAVAQLTHGVGPRNRTVSPIRVRRGDGTFGAFAQPERSQALPGFAVRRGALATVELGVEVKVLNKAMLKQIDRVLGDLEKQVRQWRRAGGGRPPLSVAVIGVNCAAFTVGYEGERVHRTDGRRYPHPAQEAPKVVARIQTGLVERDIYDEVLVLRFVATNEAPFAFDWADPPAARQDYAAALVRLAAACERRLLDSAR